jgi:hypothetical protein
MSDIKVVNFKRAEIVAESKKAAIAKVEKDLFSVYGDATQAYRAWLSKQVNGVTDRDKKAFMLNYLEKKSKNCPGAGYIICLDPAVADTRDRPYKIENVKNTGGKRKQKKTLTWIDDETKKVLARVQGTKTTAAKALKDLYKNEGYRGSATCEIHYDIVEGNPVVMKAKYTPSKGSKNGCWLAFGLEQA